MHFYAKGFFNFLGQKTTKTNMDGTFEHPLERRSCRKKIPHAPNFVQKKN